MKVQDQHQIKPETQSCQTSVIASTVYLQDCVEGMKLFEDNYFDLMPGKDKIVKVRTDISYTDFSRQLKIKSLVDGY